MKLGTKETLFIFVLIVAVATVGSIIYNLTQDSIEDENNRERMRLGYFNTLKYFP